MLGFFFTYKQTCHISIAPVIVILARWGFNMINNIMDEAPIINFIGFLIAFNIIILMVNYFASTNNVSQNPSS